MNSSYYTEICTNPEKLENLDSNIHLIHLSVVENEEKWNFTKTTRYIEIGI